MSQFVINFWLWLSPLILPLPLPLPSIPVESSHFIGDNGCEGYKVGILTVRRSKRWQMSTRTLKRPKAVP